jgi:hypothetical protein
MNENENFELPKTINVPKMKSRITRVDIETNYGDGMKRKRIVDVDMMRMRRDVDQEWLEHLLNFLLLTLNKLNDVD